MADHFYGVNLGGGADPFGVSTGTSTTSKKVELRIEDSVTGLQGNKVEILRAIEAIKSKILEGNAPS
ncbi:hypothetical protein [Caudoviricetes sp.]|nr:hypothetical protein [Caudoviricetes sp.]